MIKLAKTTVRTKKLETGIGLQSNGMKKINNTVVGFVPGALVAIDVEVGLYDAHKLNRMILV